jgi:dihydrofolate reductase
MRKIIVVSMITLDGVMQAPGGPEEDPSGGFQYGGWTAPYGDDVLGQVMQKQMAPTDLLLGRKTYEIFAGYWPEHAAYWPGINEVTKYVLTNTLKTTLWNNSVILRSLAEIQKLKDTDGGDLKVWGSSELIHLLMKHDLVDELSLHIHPLVLGKGKKTFEDSSIPAAFALMESVTTPSGVLVATYQRAGDVKTGTVGP